MSALKDKIQLLLIKDLEDKKITKEQFDETIIRLISAFEFEEKLIKKRDGKNNIL